MLGLLRIALGIFGPALFCGLLLTGAQRAGAGARTALSGVAFGTAWFAAYVALAGTPAWPSAEKIPAARDWLAWVVLLAALASLLHLTRIPARMLAAITRPVLSAALVVLSLRTWAERSGSWATLGLSFLVILSAWTAADRWIARADGPRAPLALLVAAIGVSLANHLAHSALLGAIAGALAASLAASTILAALVPSFRLLSGARAVIALVLAGCVLDGLVFSDLPLASALLLTGAVLAPGLLDLRGARSEGIGGRGSWKNALLGAALAFVPTALAVWIAWTPGEDLF
jgi:hypothetical protein